MSLDPTVVESASLLDEKRPGWENEIDLGTFELADTRFCILGQLYGHYRTGLIMLGIDEADLNQDHGFTFSGLVAYLYKSAEWRKEIKRRKRERS